MEADRDGVVDRVLPGDGRGEMERAEASSTNGGALGLLPPEPGEGNGGRPA